MESLALFVFLFIFTLICFSTFKLYKRRLGLPPGPTPFPLVGNLLQGSTILYDTYHKFTERYGPIFTLWMGTSPMVVLCGYEVVKDALINYSKQFSYRGSLPISERLSGGYGIITTNGEPWQQTRRFTVTTLKNSGLGTRTVDLRIQEEASHLIKAVKELNGQAFDPLTLLERAVNNVINLSVFGRRWDYEDQQFQKFINTINYLLVFLRSPLGVTYSAFPGVMRCLPGRHNKIFNDTEDIKALIRSQVDSHLDTLDMDSPRDFIDSFLIRMKKEKVQQDSVFSRENLVISAFEFFIAGTETTSNTVQFSLLVMIKYPQIQERVRQEIHTVIGTNRLPTLADRLELPYTNAVVHEIMRFLDLVPLSLPHKVMEDTAFRGFTIPKGTTIIPVLGSVLSDPAHWAKPKEFYPEHFLDQNGKFCMNDAFIPFSAGKRICPGEGVARSEAFLFLASLVQNFTFRAVSLPHTLNLERMRRDFRKKGLVYSLKAHPWVPSL
uniref:Cytochrome P450 n=1 Tax=Leptobrachium leishanense TaxID=445787 RepID=A0A8C5QE10_9ANUR